MGNGKRETEKKNVLAVFLGTGNENVDRGSGIVDRRTVPHMDVLMPREAGSRERLPHMDVPMPREAGSREA